MRPHHHQDHSRSRQKPHHTSSFSSHPSNHHQPSTHPTPVDPNPPTLPNTIEIHNIPQHYNESDISYFIFKNLDNLKGLVKKSLNPIIKSEYIKEKNCVMLEFRTREEALNCLELNGIFYGNRAFFMRSRLVPRQVPKLDTKNVRIRQVNSKVDDGFNKIFIGNLPEMQEYELIDTLSQIGELKALQSIPTSNKSQIQYYCQFRNKDKTDEYLTQLNNLKIRNRTIIAKRAALLPSTTSDPTKQKTIRTRRSMFESDQSTFYLTLDVDGYFKNMKISCVLLLKNMISSFLFKDEILRDIRREVSKVGRVVRMVDYEKNVYIEFERVEYAQIAYLVIGQRRFEGKQVEVSFYDPIHFADQLLC